MTPAAAGIRRGVALARMSHIVPIGVYGPHAADLVDRLVPRSLFLKDGGMAPTVMLDEGGRILADVTVVADDHDFVLLVDGMDSGSLYALVLAAVRPGEEIDVRRMWERYEIFGVHGPFAWEFMEALAGPEILGLPFLSAVGVGEDICFRSGTTGEWGYLLLVPDVEAERRWEQLLALGKRFSAVEVGLEALDTAALENGFFVVRTPGIQALSVAEAQLQWCVSPDKRDYSGCEAVLGQLAAPPARRLTWAVAAERPAEGAAIVGLDGRVVGTVLHARPALSRPGFVVLALLDTAAAHPGWQNLRAGGVALETVSSPVVPNLSLALDPQRHRFATRTDDFPGWDW